MNTKTLSARSMDVIDQYKNFKFGNATCSIPYYNNKNIRKRGSLRTVIGKGSPREIFEELEDISIKNHISKDLFTNDSLKKVLVDNDIGIDCSAFVYYVLNAESEENQKGSIDKHLTFTNCSGIFGKLRCSLRPIENCAVITFTDNKNSHSVSVKDVLPGDIITFTKQISSNLNAENSEENILDKNSRDHILVIHQIEYQNFVPITIHYSHAISYPEDGLYGSGIREGQIDIIDSSKNIMEQRWIEDNKEGDLNPIFIRAKKSYTEIRRLNWF